MTKILTICGRFLVVVCFFACGFRICCLVRGFNFCLIFRNMSMRVLFCTNTQNSCKNGPLLARRTQAAVFPQVSHQFSFVSSEIVSGAPTQQLEAIGFGGRTATFLQVLHGGVIVIGFHNLEMVRFDPEVWTGWHEMLWMPAANKT